MTTKEEEEEAKSQRRTNLKNRFLFGHMKWDTNWKSREEEGERKEMLMKTYTAICVDFFLSVYHKTQIAASPQHKGETSIHEQEQTVNAVKPNKPSNPIHAHHPSTSFHLHMVPSKP